MKNLALIGAAGYWAANIGILWAAFKAFGVHVPFAVVVQGFFLGMAANLPRSRPARQVDLGRSYSVGGRSHAEMSPGAK